MADNFVWEPTGSFAGHTRYTVELGPGVLDEDGSPIADAERLVFTTTTAPSVVRFRPRAGTRGRRPRGPRLRALHRADGPRLHGRGVQRRGQRQAGLRDGRLRRERHGPGVRSEAGLPALGHRHPPGLGRRACRRRRVARPWAGRHLHRRRQAEAQAQAGRRRVDHGAQAGAQAGAGHAPGHWLVGCRREVPAHAAELHPRRRLGPGRRLVLQSGRQRDRPAHVSRRGSATGSRARTPRSSRPPASARTSTAAPIRAIDFAPPGTPATSGRRTSAVATSVTRATPR